MYLILIVNSLYLMMINFVILHLKENLPLFLLIINGLMEVNYFQEHLKLLKYIDDIYRLEVRNLLADRILSSIYYLLS
jgi:hypothetical protein